MKNIEANIHKHLPSGEYSLTIYGDDFTIDVVSLCYAQHPGNHTSVAFQGIEFEDIGKISKCLYAAIIKEVKDD